MSDNNDTFVKILSEIQSKVSEVSNTLAVSNTAQKIHIDQLRQDVQELRVVAKMFTEFSSSLSMMNTSLAEMRAMISEKSNEAESSVSKVKAEIDDRLDEMRLAQAEFEASVKSSLRVSKALGGAVLVVALGMAGWFLQRSMSDHDILITLQRTQELEKEARKQ